MTEIKNIIDKIKSLRKDTKTFFIAIDGFGGSGKTTAEDIPKVMPLIEGLNISDFLYDEQVNVKWGETKNAPLAVSLFDDDATYAATPYREVLKGKEAIHDYWKSNISTQEDITFNYEILAIKDNYGIAHAWGSMIQDGKHEQWDGIFWPIFNEKDKCITWREWWVSK